MSPADFGTVALLAVFVTIGIVAADAGMTTAILQAQKISSADLNPAFWSSLAFGGGLTAVGTLLAYPISTAFGRRELARVGGLFSLAILATSVGQSPSPLLIRDGQFVRLMGWGGGGRAFGRGRDHLGGGGQGLRGAGGAVRRLSRVRQLLLLAVGPFRPRVESRRTCARRLFVAGRWGLAANLVDSAYLRLQVVIIGGSLRSGPACSIPAGRLHAAAGRRRNHHRRWTGRPPAVRAVCPRHCPCCGPACAPGIRWVTDRQRAGHGPSRGAIHAIPGHVLRAAVVARRGRCCRSSCLSA